MKNKEQPLSSSLDYYKLTMGNVVNEKHPDAEVTFTFKNRNTTKPLTEYVSANELQARLDIIRENGFTPEEIAYYAGIKAQSGEAQFTPEYLDHLADMQLPEVAVETNHDTNDLAIQTTGPWADVSLWETVIMSEVNEIYYSRLVDERGLSLTDIYDEGNRRLDKKIEKLASRPDIKFADFGTRRRFSATWHEYVIRRLSSEVPNNFVGTSNPWFAYKFNLKPIGTFAHEMPMVYAGLADSESRGPLEAHNEMLQDWEDVYNGELSIALTDTFGSEFFFNDFTPKQAASWNGLRHDSGDPIAFGEQTIAFYEANGIDPTEKTIVFSDGLDIDKIIELADYFNGRINLTFGWGTSLMNDLGIPANNFVMKATAVNGTETVKLSDDQGKHTGSQEKVEFYQSEAHKINKAAKRVLRETVSIS